MINNKQFDLNNIECVRDITPESAVSYSGGKSTGVALFGSTKLEGRNKKTNFLFIGKANRNSEGKAKFSQGALFFELPDKR